MVLVVAVVAVIVLPAGVVIGGKAIVDKLTEKGRVRRALREAGAMFDVDPDILDAIGYVESRWTMGARNLTGTDGARGGAWGPTQITERTARAHGYTGDVAAFTRDAALAAEWTARIMRNRPGGPPVTIQDAAAWWNAGRTYAAQLGPSHVTVTTYIPRAVAALDMVQTEPIA